MTYLRAKHIIGKILDSRAVYVDQSTGNKVNRFILDGSDEVYEALYFAYRVLEEEVKSIYGKED